MKQEELISLKKWFAGYCASFSTPVREDQQNITVKQLHTHEVCKNALRIGRALRLNEEDLLLAEAVALLHDVGRFPQYRRYKTFDDSISVNHATLGAQVLLAKDVLGTLLEDQRNLIVHTVTLHNVYSLPGNLDDRTMLFVKLIRDADKLDIWRVFVDYFNQDHDGRATAVGLGLADVPDYSPAILACLTRGEMANKADLRTLNDFKLLQLSWLYDLNFADSLRMVLERGYIDKLAKVLPDVQEINGAVAFVRTYVERKLTGSGQALQTRKG
ncbi:MAG TPA: HD domain-containing protein [Nitrospirota bacterium]|nr:HD domain-containing protein [Nitrospirota bacterium]